MDGSLIEGPGSSRIDHIGEVYFANGDGLVAESHLSPGWWVADETVAGGVVDDVGQVVVDEGRFRGGQVVVLLGHWAILIVYDVVFEAEDVEVVGINWWEMYLGEKCFGA